MENTLRESPQSVAPAPQAVAPTPAPTDVTRREAGPDSVSLTVPPVDSLRKTLATRTDLGSTRRPSLVAAIAGGEGASADRYEEGRVLGKGGMGVVVLANDRDLARPVAVKRLQSEQASAEDVRRFLREAQVTAQLEHPGIVPIHDVGIDDERRFYYVMRLVRGDKNLRSVIDKLKAGDEAARREYTFERRVRIVQQVCQILGYAHSKGVIHRDVKPENIMLGPFGEVYVVDWGLAKVVNAPDDAPRPAVPLPAELAPNETQAGSILGTPLYMAPEQANAQPATARSDIYSLCAVLYELLTLHHYLGKPSTSFAKLANEIFTQKPAMADSYYDAKNGRVPRHLALAVDAGLDKNPEYRYASGEELETELERWIEGDGAILCPATFQIRALNEWRRLVERHPALMTVAFQAMIFALLALVAYAVWSAVHHA